MDLLFLWSAPIDWWRYLIVLFGLIGATHLPYGERTPYPVKALVGCTYSLPFLGIGFHPWMIVTPVLFILLFYLSNKSGFFSSAFVWKIVEFVIGVLIGITTAFFIKHNEILMIAAMATGGILFPLGGTGYKWARRFVMPFALTGILLLGLGI